MMRLTKTKMPEVELPDLPLINRGNTSMIFDSEDYIIGFTVESLKVEWLYRGLDILIEWGWVGEARYSGYAYEDYRMRHKNVVLDVYRYDMPKLQMASNYDPEVKRLRAWLDEFFVKGYQKYKSGYSRRLEQFWHGLRIQEEEPFFHPYSNHICNYDIRHIHPDMGPGDWAYLPDGSLACIDPFHHDDVNEALSLRQSPD